MFRPRSYGASCTPGSSIGIAISLFSERITTFVSDITTTDRQHVDGMIDPRFVWTPSIAPSGLAVYHGAIHPEWESRLLVGALAFRLLAQVRVNPQNGLLAEEGRWLAGLKARIRDVRVAPDGNVYLLTDDAKGRLLRVVAPATPQ